VKCIIPLLALELLCAAAALPARADDAAPAIRVMRVPLGSGTPSSGTTAGSEHAYEVAAGTYHVPNHMPGFPTAATIWPRQLLLGCVEAQGELECDGFAVHPSIGRGEYIYVSPAVTAPPPAPAASEMLIIQVPPCPCDEPAKRPPRKTHKLPLG
jgi:hypothetical protein